jgi:hypothetical protein
VNPSEEKPEHGPKNTWDFGASLNQGSTNHAQPGCAQRKSSACAFAAFFAGLLT